jgi:hypothetical protein
VLDVALDGSRIDDQRIGDLTIASARRRIGAHQDLALTRRGELSASSGNCRSRKRMGGASLV